MAIDRRRIRAATQKIFERHVKALDSEFKVTFNSAIFDWPRTTIRSTGEAVSSPRDIVDTGKLRDSQTLVIHPMYARFTWPVRYAPYVLVGTAKTPPRDWIQTTFDRI